MNNPHKEEVKPQPTTRQARVQLKEAGIVRAARDIFLESGFSGATMAQIARRAGVADGTLYTYFQNKEALAEAVISDFYARLTLSAQAGVDALSHTIDQLKFLARHHLTHIIEERKILEMLPLIDVNLETYEGSDLFNLNKSYVVIFDRMVKYGQAHGAIRPNLSLWVLRDIFFGAMDYGSRTMIIKGREGALETFVDEIVDLITTPRQVRPSGDLAQLTDRLELTAERLENLLGERT